jgi:hypothetical protein
VQDIGPTLDLERVSKVLAWCDAVKARACVQDSEATTAPPRQRRLQSLDARAVERYEQVVGPLRQQLEDVQARISAIRQLMVGTPFGPARNTMRRHLSQLLNEQGVLLDRWLEVQDQICSRYPGSPNVEYFETGQPVDTSWVRPNRIYLDVTDALQEEVTNFWPIVQWRQKALAGQGHSSKRGPGAPRGPRDPETERWVQVAATVGRTAARKQCVDEMVAAEWDRIEAGRWFDSVVAPHLRRGGKPKDG